MEFRHSKKEPEEYGHSPGNGTTEIPLSQTPLATEGEATPGPDDVNPYDERENEIARNNGGGGGGMPEFESRAPTSGDDPFVFDDVSEGVAEFELPHPEPPDFDMPFF